MKANDAIPEDEMMLAEALAAARSRGMGWSHRALFRDISGIRTDDIDSAASCCALGALCLAGLQDPNKLTPPKIAEVVTGNDRGIGWTTHAGDCGESLGWAFRLAMTQEEP